MPQLSQFYIINSEYRQVTNVPDSSFQGNEPLLWLLTWEKNSHLTCGSLLSTTSPTVTSPVRPALTHLSIISAELHCRIWRHGINHIAGTKTLGENCSFRMCLLSVVLHFKGFSHWWELSGGIRERQRHQPQTVPQVKTGNHWESENIQSVYRAASSPADSLSLCEVCK